jgi:uncharacterized membrane protein/glutaredoxin
LTRFHPASFLILGLLAVVLTVTPALAQTEPPVVRAVMLWMNGCPHCHEVLDHVLPPLQEKYGPQLEILLVEVRMEYEVDRLYQIAADYSISSERVGVPFLIIGDHVLVGSEQIAVELPGLIETYLAAGGLDFPDIQGLETFSSRALLPTLTSQLSIEGANVHIVLFSTPECHACQLITGQVLMLVRERYAEQVTIEMVDIVNSEDVEYLYQVAAGFGIPRDNVDLPLLVIGDQVLIGEDIPSGLPALIETYLQSGGVERPQISPTRSNGFTLAIVAMTLMAAALIYSIIAFARGKTFTLPAWGDWFIPALIIIGIGVAGYLSYVETQSIEAMCGPVGDCNTVQQSRYARLFDILPVGVLGLMGYIALLASWLARKYIPKFEKLAAIGYFGMAFFAVIFSLYLTYLEPFVIKAVCIWCLTSTVIVTLLLLLGTPPAVLQFAISDGNE